MTSPTRSPFTGRTRSISPSPSLPNPVVDAPADPPAEPATSGRSRWVIGLGAVAAVLVLVAGTAALLDHGSSRSDTAPSVEVSTTTVPSPADDAARQVRLQAGGSLAANPALQMSPDALDLVRNGLVDDRLLNVLATLGAQHDLGVAAFPAQPGEDGVGLARRTVEIDGIDFTPVAAGSPPVTAVTEFLARQLPAYRPASVEVDGSTLRITYARADSPSAVSSSSDPTSV